jgi:hypothetical protein
MSISRAASPPEAVHPQGVHRGQPTFGTHNTNRPAVPLATEKAYGSPIGGSTVPLDETDDPSDTVSDK